MATRRVVVARLATECAMCQSVQPMTVYATVAWRRRFGVVPCRVVQRVREVCDRCGWSRFRSPVEEAA